MGYSGYSTPTPPRSLRVILGAKVFLLCLFFGALMVTHKYHRALTMQTEPTEYDWHSLDDVGLGDNAFVKLTDVQLTGIEEMMEGFGNFGELDPDADPEEIQAQFEGMMEDMEPMDLNAGCARAHESYSRRRRSRRHAGPDHHPAKPTAGWKKPPVRWKTMDSCRAT